MKYNWFSKPVFVTLATSITLSIRFYLHFLIARLPYVASKISCGKNWEFALRSCDSEWETATKGEEIGMT